MPQHPLNRWTLATAALLCLWAALILADEQLGLGNSGDADKPRYTTETIGGRIVWMAEAMERLHGVRAVDEAAERVIALESPAGELFPLLEDVRGRAFRADKRLRELKDCELEVRRFPGSPLVQVMHVYSYEDGAKYELDYYCDVCAIVMFELKACECCQGETELRRTAVKE